MSRDSHTLTRLTILFDNYVMICTKTRLTNSDNVHIMYVHQMDYMTPRQVKALRKRLGFTQSQLARVLAVGRSAVNNWERGNQKPLPMAVKFMRLLEQLHAQGIDFEKLMKTKEEKKA